MELHEQEQEKAKALLVSQGKDPDSYSFDVTFLPPDPDGGGMFTMRYTVLATNEENGNSLEMIGGIGLDWVAVFEEALEEGYFA